MMVDNAIQVEELTYAYARGTLALDRVSFGVAAGECVGLVGPAIHLDPRGRREFIRLIQRLEGTRLIASHDLELILETCPRCLVLDRGCVIAEGSARQLLADAALMEAHGLEVPYSLR